MKKLALIALISMFATGAIAHSRVDSTVPENGAVLAQAPVEIEFNFTKKIRLTKVEITRGDTAPVSLDLSAQTGFGRDFVVAMKEMDAGNYSVDWRGLGADGHAMQGTFAYTVK